VLLLATLACSPLNRLFGFRQALTVRRALGLWTFFYVTLHFLIFTVVDYGLELDLLRDAIFDKPYALVGFTAFLLLIPLAVTSTKGWMKRLGKRWTKLHYLIYPTAVLVIIHYVWLVKSDIRTPLAFGAGVALLLALRRPGVRKFLTGLRSQWSHRRQAAPAAPDRVKSLTVRAE
jgi:methionine sulfoxide reductase heme-binding subunit